MSEQNIKPKIKLIIIVAKSLIKNKKQNYYFIQLMYMMKIN